MKSRALAELSSKLSNSLSVPVARTKFPQRQPEKLLLFVMLNVQPKNEPCGDAESAENCADRDETAG